MPPKPVQVSIADSPLPSGAHPDELRPRLTPRGRASNTNERSTQAQLPPPSDDIFKSSYWPSLPIGTASLEMQVLNAKLDMIMAYLQDIRASQAVTTRTVSRATSRASSASSAKKDTSVPKDFEKFDIPDEEVGTFMTEAKSATRLDDDFSERAVRLYILENPKDGSYTNNAKGCKEAGLRFRDKILELGINFQKLDRDSIEKWDAKDAGQFLLKCLKDRRTGYDRENASADDAEDPAHSYAADPDDQSIPAGDDEDMSEPVRARTGSKSTARKSGGGSAKRRKDDLDDFVVSDSEAAE